MEPEASYPISFQGKQAAELGGYLRQRQSVNIIGMKRVGIGNFLRFFLNHKNIIATYVDKKQQHLFIPVDLNDLVEREIYPFWTLTLKRIVDAVEVSHLPAKTKQRVGELFDKSLQSQDLFLIIDSIRHALALIVEKGFFPTLFFIRFDRLKDKFNPSFFDNLEGLRDATSGNLAYVFTSDRRLSTLAPTAGTLLSIFAQILYVGPISDDDMRVLYDTYKKRYNFSLSEASEQALFSAVNGYVQYLQLALVILNENKGAEFTTLDVMLHLLAKDERIILQSEELWESLTKEEQRVLLEVAKKQKIQPDEKMKAHYLWETGLIKQDDTVFSPLFALYVLEREKEEHKKNRVAHLTRKEHLLFELLKAQLGEICDRDTIIAKVWPEYQEFGVSDWAIDRLVARVRVKLREQGSPYEIVTVRTRGYKLTSVKE